MHDILKCLHSRGKRKSFKNERLRNMARSSLQNFVRSSDTDTSRSKCVCKWNTASMPQNIQIHKLYIPWYKNRGCISIFSDAGKFFCEFLFHSQYNFLVWEWLYISNISAYLRPFFKFHSIILIRNSWVHSVGGWGAGKLSRADFSSFHHFFKRAIKTMLLWWLPA